MKKYYCPACNGESDKRHCAKNGHYPPQLVMLNDAQMELIDKMRNATSQEEMNKLGELLPKPKYPKK